MSRPRGERTGRDHPRQYSLLTSTAEAHAASPHLPGSKEPEPEEPGSAERVFEDLTRGSEQADPDNEIPRALRRGLRTAQTMHGRQRHWLALCFPELSLDILYRGAAPNTPRPPVVIVSGTEVRPRVVCASHLAAEAGVEIGMSASAASALVAGLTIRRRDPAAERVALESLAAWASQFSSLVSLNEGNGLLIETGGSRRLFGGLGVLLGQVLDGLSDLGYRAMPGMAPTASAAWLLAKGGDPDPVERVSSLPGRIGPLPVQLLDLDERTLEALHGMGLHSLADCTRMPRDGFARRFGPDFLAQLDRAHGRRPEAVAPFKAALSFARRLTLPDEIEETERLLNALRPLLIELSGFLRARSAGVRGLELHLAHRDGPATRLTLSLVAPSRDCDRLLDLMSERLERLMLPSSVIYLAIRAKDIEPLNFSSGDLYHASTAEGEAWDGLVERLRARLGNDAVLGIASSCDHRPERAWERVEPGERGMAVDTRSRPLRPTWLLPQPVPLTVVDNHPYHGGRLDLRDGPERIESGWWDEADLARDYYLASSPVGSRYWVYRERRGERRWFLHGIFA